MANIFRESEGVFMRDWFNASSLYVPAWVLAGTVMGIFGPHSAFAITIWLLVGLVIALFAWRASAAQTRQSREIHENLGKLVSVTESSPTNVIAAVAAKILTLERQTAAIPALETELDHHRAKLKSYESTTWLVPSYDEKQEAKTLLQGLGKHSVRIKHTGQPDCYEFAIELAELFREAGWVVPLFGNKASVEGARGIEVRGHIGNPLIGQVNNALLRITRMTQGGGDPHYAGSTDIEISIGPRKLRGGEWV
jgi:hypothetical protein